MDVDDFDISGGHGQLIEDDSGSLYESSSENVNSPVTKGKSKASRISKTGPSRERSRSPGQNSPTPSEDNHPRELRDDGGNSNDIPLEDAAAWAANFEPPDSPGRIKTPPRGRRSYKRRQAQPVYKIRAKRLKLYYNYDYRELLNVDIQQTESRMHEENPTRIEASQIGSSIWTSEEKELFFNGLANHGRDNVRDIASKIESKSELQVQEYLQLLDHALTEKKFQDAHLLRSSKIPAAYEVTEECCTLLERAGDAIGIRQECSEVQTESEKWGDIWLITHEVSRRIDRRRKDENGEKDIEEVLPAANLFNLRNWIELSENVFMNPAAPREEDNWQSLAEEGEFPGVRATAFADFHSLAVSITKRLVSTALYCTMTKLRARDAHKVKHAEVNAHDVEAAVKILGIQKDSKRFWTESARRCNLHVINTGLGENDEEEEEAAIEDIDEQAHQVMTHDEVEVALTSALRRRSRSRSISRALSRSSIAISEADTSPVESDHSTDSSMIDSSLDPASDSSSDASVLSSSSHNRLTRDEREHLVKLAARTAAEQAYETWLEESDMAASREEESQLWKMLKQSPPFDLEIKIEENANPPRPVPDSMEGENWREVMEYWSQWEILESPVPEAAFERNRRRMDRGIKAREALIVSGDFEGSGNFGGEEVEAIGDESEVAGGGENDNAEDDQDSEDEILDDIPPFGLTSPSHHVDLSDDEIMARGGNQEDNSSTSS